jgi:hypothetical protein
MTLAMIIMICVGCGLIIAALVFLAVRIYRLAKIGVAVQKELDAEVRVLLQKQEGTMARVEHLQMQQPVLAANIGRVQASFGRLGFLVNEFGRARARLAALVRVR